MDKSLLLKNLYQCYLEARRHKRHTHSQMVFEQNLSENLVTLRDDLYNRSYEISPSIYFIQMEPIQREVFAGNFRDRIVHHLIYNIISPYWEKQFIFDSYSCRKGKGTGKWIERISKFMRSCTNNYKEEGWILKLDIQGYFMSINRDLLWQKVSEPLLHREELDWNKRSVDDFPKSIIHWAFPEFLIKAIKDVIYNDPTASWIFKGKPSDYDGLPKTKSLFFANKNCGLPIGNLTSQLFSNIYLNEFDHFMKEELGIKYYWRYVDDFVVIHKEKEYLKSIIPHIKRFLQERLKVTLHPKKIYLQPIHNGVQFLGAVIKPYRIYRAKRTIVNFRRAMRLCHYQPNNVASINSYLWLFIHYNQYKLVSHIVQKLDFSKLPKISHLIKYYSSNTINF